MTSKIFRSMVFAAAFVFIASVILIMGVIHPYFTNIQWQQLREQTNLCAQGLNHSDEKFFDDLESEGFRITWISKDGEVKYDNAASYGSMENHIKREEIREALESGSGESSRYSTTMMERQLYVAKKLDDGSVIRLSTTQQTIFGLLIGVLNPLIIVMILTLALSFFLAYRLSKRITKPLNEMDLDGSDAPYEELEPLVTKIRNQKAQIAKQEQILAQKKEEFEATILNMNEGVLVMKNDGYIVSVNKAAKKILQMNAYPEGKRIYDYNSSYELRNMLIQAEEGKHVETEIPIDGTDYEFHASPIYRDDEVSAISVIIMDMTEKEKAEMIRREFTDNVSHELKTPLQTISGSAELLSKGMVEDGDVKDFAGKIYQESQRMIALVDDIIKLSRIEEGKADLVKEEVDLYGIAELTVREMTEPAERSGTELELTGESVIVNGVPQLLGSLVFNLVDNAIKYGREGGKVEVDVKQKDGKAVLSVRDNGIGIPDDEKERIFERFYRVDKSRSKEVGGTGLGLSIVKHAAMVHNADVELESKLGEGTEIRVIFPL